MKKWLIFIMVICMGMIFTACGSEESAEAPTSYTPTDIQVEALDDGTNIYSVIYDIDPSDSDAWREAWSGYDSDELCVNTAVEGIKACMDRDDWVDNSVVNGYAREALLKYELYSFGTENTLGIDLFQLGIYNDTYTLQGELDK